MWGAVVGGAQDGAWRCKRHSMEESRGRALRTHLLPREIVPAAMGPPSRRVNRVELSGLLPPVL